MVASTFNPSSHTSGGAHTPLISELGRSIKQEKGLSLILKISESEEKGKIAIFSLR